MDKLGNDIVEGDGVTEKPVDSPEIDFSGLKKKKSKKSVAFTPDTADDGAPLGDEVPAGGKSRGPSEAPVADDDFNAMFANVKKKKKKKSMTTASLALDEVEGQDEADEVKESAPVPETSKVEDGAAAEDFASFEGLKKKKKSKSDLSTSKPKTLEAFEKEIEDEELDAGAPLNDDDPFGAAADDGADGGTSLADGSIEEASWQSSDRDYSYSELLGRVFRILKSQNPELAGEKRRYKLVPPQIYRDGTKKSVFANIADICKRMHRSPEHVIQFLFAELGTTGNVDGSGRLVIKGRFQQKQIENVLRRYIVEYVTCKTCRSPDTILRKENRLFFMTCESCGSTRTVSGIASGFRAQIGKRIKN